MSINESERVIYEIFRACRLCGAGGGYKMPIIPSVVVEFEFAGVELRQKIRECVQIEVNQDDKMPPLICELCLDKVNDFYEFLEMCRETNVKTRQRLGLPETNTQNSLDMDNCILGVTEPVYVRDEDDEPLAKRGARSKREENQIHRQEKKADREERRRETEKKEKDRVRGSKKELKNLIKQENESPEPRTSRDSSRAGRHRRPATPLPPRETRQLADGLALSNLKQDNTGREPRSSRDSTSRAGRHRRPDTPPPPPLAAAARQLADDIALNHLKDLGEDKDDEALAPRGKRLQTRDSKDAPPKKKIKFSKVRDQRSESPVPKSKPGPKSSKSDQRSESPAPKSKPGPKWSKGGQRSESPAPKSKPGPKSSKGPPKVAVPPPKVAGPLPKVAGPPPKVARPPPKITGPPPDAARPLERECTVCASVFQTGQGLSSHIRSTHQVRYTPKDLACDPCGEWFASVEETNLHHKQHKNRNKPYPCRGCGRRHRTLQEYTQHVTETSCVPWSETPDVKCAECWRAFPTEPLLRSHRCPGAGARPGGKCSKCNKTYATLNTLKKHESTCASKITGPGVWAGVSASERARLLGARVRVARCDALLAPDGAGRYMVSNLPADFGADPCCVYPYRAVRVKREPLAADSMVSIVQPGQLYREEDYVHWDSDTSSSGDEYLHHRNKKVPQLTTLALKTIFSKQCLGRVPKKFRKVRTDKFDSFYNPDNEFDAVNSEINDLINNLGDDNTCSETLGFSTTDAKSFPEIASSTDNDSISLIEKTENANDEFDSLLKNYRSESNNMNTQSIKSGEIENCVNGMNTRLMNVENADNGSDTDASLEDKTESQAREPNDINQGCQNNIHDSVLPSSALQNV